MKFLILTDDEYDKLKTASIYGYLNTDERAIFERVLDAAAERSTIDLLRAIEDGCDVLVFGVTRDAAEQAWVDQVEDEDEADDFTLSDAQWNAFVSAYDDQSIDETVQAEVDNAVVYLHTEAGAEVLRTFEAQP